MLRRQYICVRQWMTVTLHCVSGEFRDKTLVKKSNSVSPMTTTDIEDVL